MAINKVVNDGYILCIGEDINGIEITEEEHKAILEAMASKPNKEGYYYKLRNDTLTYDEYELPTETDERKELSDE